MTPVGGRGELGHRGVVAIPADDLIGDAAWTSTRSAQLGVAAGDPGRRVGDQQHPDVGVRERPRW